MNMLDELKKSLVDAAKEAERTDLCKHKSGNFSVFDPESQVVIVTPSGVARSELRENQLCVLNLDAQVLAWNGINKPSSEVLMHIAIYKKRPDIGAIVHTHSRYATAFAILNKSIPPILYESFVLGQSPRIPVAPYARPGTSALARSVSSTLQDADCCLLESHGAIALGANLEEALLRANYVEELSELYYLTLSINQGREPKTLAQEELQKWAYPTDIKFPEDDCYN